MARSKILVVGDLMLDRRIEGAMTRISKEAPCPIIREGNWTEVPGGAGNLAVNLVHFFDPHHSGKVRVLGVTGQDHVCVALSRLLTERGCAVHTISAPGKRTTVKTRITCGGQQILRLDSEEDQLLAEGELASAVLHALNEHTDVMAVVVSDYNHGALAPTVIQTIMNACASYAVPLFVDAKPTRHAHMYARASLFKCNLSEALALAEATGRVHPALYAGNPVDQATCAARTLRENWQFATVVITMGADGCLFHDGLNFAHLPATAVGVADVTGAGDTFMAALVTRLVQGLSTEVACKHANLAAGLAVREHGTSIVTADEWEDAVEATGGIEAKLTTVEGTRHIAARKRRQGKTIVLTNGCFDLLHHGHLHLLAEARACGAVLFVAVNTDESVRALKGETRPVVPLAERLRALARFAPVDYVLPFDGDVNSVVRAIHPDVLVKGAEYANTTVPGADLVASHGGTVRFVPMVTGYSTTEILRAQG